MLHWAMLFIAIFLEVAGTTFMKLSDGMNKHIYCVFMLICYVLSLSVLTFVLKHIPMGVAYAIWSACGIVLIVSIGAMFFNDRIYLPQLLFIGLIIIGVIGLNLTTKVH